MSYFCVDVESDGPIIGKHSMVCFGAVLIKDGLKETFYGKTAPISENYVKEALAISGFTRSEHLLFDDPQKVMWDFHNWILKHSKGRPVLISDNNGYDASWINFYFMDQINVNPFGWSSRRIGDLYCGLVKDAHAKWKHLRSTIHDHNPVNDAKGNAEAVLKMRDMGLKINLT